MPLDNHYVIMLQMNTITCAYIPTEYKNETHYIDIMKLRCNTWDSEVMIFTTGMTGKDIIT